MDIPEMLEMATHQPALLWATSYFRGVPFVEVGCGHYSTPIMAGAAKWGDDIQRPYIGIDLDRTWVDRVRERYAIGYPIFHVSAISWRAVLEDGPAALLKHVAKDPTPYGRSQYSDMVEAARRILSASPEAPFYFLDYGEHSRERARLLCQLVTYASGVMMHDYGDIARAVVEEAGRGRIAAKMEWTYSGVTTLLAVPEVTRFSDVIERSKEAF